jgi:hypothetical protein
MIRLVVEYCCHAPLPRCRRRAWLRLLGTEYLGGNTVDRVLVLSGEDEVCGAQYVRRSTSKYSVWQGVNWDRWLVSCAGCLIKSVWLRLWPGTVGAQAVKLLCIA